MAEKFKLLVGPGKNQAAQTIDIDQGGKPVTVKAQAGVRYQLAKADSPQAPHTVRAKRAGKDLQVFLEDSQQADLVIENYYDEMPAGFNALVGQAENGSVYEYIPENANAASLVPNLADGGNLVGMALGGSEELVLAGVPLVAATGGGGLGILAAGLGVAALAGGGKGGGGPAADTTAPSGQTGALAADSDTGVPGDNITKNKTPTITGKAEAGSTVEVTINGKTYTTKANTNGDYSIDIPAGDTLPDGKYIPKIKVTDAAGNYSTVDGTQFIVDTTTTVLITDPGKGATTNAISGTGEPGAVVTVKDAQQNVMGSATVDATGHWTLTPTAAMATGQLTATATDPSGNTANTASDNTGVAPVPPAITSVTDNVAGQTGAIQKYTAGISGGLDKGVTNDNTPTISGTATPGAVVKLYDAGVQVGSTTAGADGLWSITPPLSTQGVHTFTADATLGGASSAKTGDYPILLDSTAPTTPVVDPTGTNANTGTGTGNTYSVIDTVGASTGVVVNQSTIDDATPTINGKGEVGATVTIYDGTAVLGTAVVGTDGKWSYKPTTPFVNGSTHTISTTVTDGAGNSSVPSAGTTFTIDTSNTPVALTSVTDDIAAKTGGLNPNDITNDNKPTLVGTGAPNTTVTIKDGNTPIGTALVDANGNWTFTPTTPLSEGDHSLVVTGTDKAQNPSSTAPFAFTVDTAAPAAPLINAFADDVGSVQNANTLTAQYTDDTTPTLKGTAEAGSTVTIKDSTGAVKGVATADDSGNWSYTLAELRTNGSYTYTASAMDAAGNASGNSNAFNLILDTTAPNAGAAPTVTITTDGNNDGSVNAAELNGAATFAVKAEFDKTKVAVGDKVTFNDGHTVQVVELTQADINNGYATTTFNKPAEGATLTVTATVSDAAGNSTAQGSDNAKLDTLIPNAGAAPTVTITTDGNNDGYVNAAELNGAATFAVKAEFDKTKVAVGDKVTFNDGNTVQVVELTQADINNGYATTTFAKPAEGATLTVTAIVSDAADSSTTQGSDNAKLDTLTPNASGAPTVTITTDGNNDGYVNAAELNGADTFAVKAEFDKTKVAVGDKVTFDDGTTIKVIELTQTDINNGYATTTFSKPAEGAALTVTAIVNDAAGNSTAQGTDSATLDITAPTLTNAAVGLAVAITTDANNDSFVNTSEIASSTTFTSRISFNASAVAGDKVIISASNGSTALTPLTHVLTAADITARGFDVTFDKPANGSIQTVSATYADPASNPATDAPVTDSATLDITAPNAAAAPTVTITTDANNDGTVNAAELNGAPTFAVKAEFDKTKVAVGDKVTFNNGTTDTVIVLTQTDIDNGYATTTFVKPAEGATLTVTATVKDAAGNPTAQGSDSAILDTILPNNVGTAPTVTITTDINNDGTVNAAELNGALTFAVKAEFDPARVAVGDKVIFNNGTTITTIPLTQADINLGYVTTTFAKPVEGATLTVTAKIQDAARNETATGSDSAILDTSVSSSNTAPTLSASSVGGVYTAGSAAGVDLYGAVAGQVGSGTANSSETTAGQKFQQLIITATGLQDGSNENLIIGSTSVVLTNGTSVNLSGGWVATVSASGTTAIVTLNNSSGADATALQNLVDGLSYIDTKASVTVGQRTFTITSVKDNGGTLNNGVDSSALTIASVAYVGNPSVAGPTTVSGVNLNNIANGQGGFRIDGTFVSDTAGRYVSTIGDFNGDGLDDIAIGAYFSSDPNYNVGRTYVVYGKTDTAPILLSSLTNGTGGVVLQGAGTNPTQLGWRVAAGGDLNGDGLGDLLVGANMFGDGSLGNPSGQAYVVYGTKATLGTVDISTIGNGAKGLTITGDVTGAVLDQTRVGDDLNYAGDVNGDGLMDFVVAAGGGGGGYYVVLGKGNNNPINLADIKLGIGGFFIDPQRPTTEYTTLSNISVSPAGDVNGDGLADLIVTSPTGPGAYDPNSPSNSAYVVFGKKDNNSVYFKELAKGNGGFKITSSTAFSQVTSLGDVNGDGLADFGVVTGQNLATDPVKTYVVFGKTSNTAIDLANVANGSGGYEIKGLGDTPAFVGTFPWLNGIGDINGDGLADMVSYGPKSSDGYRQRYVIYGKASTSAINFVDITSGNSGFVIKAQNINDFRTEEDWVAPAGDVNGDGYNDLVVSDATSASNTLAADAGRTYIIFGGPGLAKGSTIANSIGTSADEWVVGTISSDVLVGGGGIDRFSAGAGNDTIVLTSSDVANLADNTAATFKAFVNGGTGFDTLRLSGGANLDLTAISNIGAMGVEENSRIESIERIDMATDSAANTTTIRIKDVTDMSGMNLFNSGTSGLSLISGASLGSLVQKHQVMITGGANDTVNINLASDWTNSGTVVSYNNHNYAVYNANNVAAQLFIDQQMVNANHVL